MFFAFDIVTLVFFNLQKLLKLVGFILPWHPRKLRNFAIQRKTPSSMEMEVGSWTLPIGFPFYLFEDWTSVSYVCPPEMTTKTPEVMNTWTHPEPTA